MKYLQKEQIETLLTSDEIIEKSDYVRLMYKEEKAVWNEYKSKNGNEDIMEIEYPSGSQDQGTSEQSGSGSVTSPVPTTDAGENTGHDYRQSDAQSF